MRFRGKLVAGVTVLLLWGAQLMGALERIDFVVTRSSDPGWLGSTFHWLINMPGWAQVALLFLGLGFTYWDQRRPPRPAPVVPNPAHELGQLIKDLRSDFREVRPPVLATPPAPSRLIAEIPAHGTFTPGIACGGVSRKHDAYSESSGDYIHRGQGVIEVYFRIALSKLAEVGPTGALTIVGLPYQVEREIEARVPSFQGIHLDEAIGRNRLILRLIPHSTAVAVYEAGGDLLMSAVTDADLSDHSEISGSFVYETLGISF